MVSTACHSGSHCRIRKTKRLFRQSRENESAIQQIPRRNRRILPVDSGFRRFGSVTDQILGADSRFTHRDLLLRGGEAEVSRGAEHASRIAPRRLLVNTVDGQYRTDRRQLCHQLVERSRFIRHVTKPPYFDRYPGSRIPIRLMTHEFRVIWSIRFPDSGLTCSVSLRVEPSVFFSFD